MNLSPTPLPISTMLVYERFFKSSLYYFIARELILAQQKVLCLPLATLLDDSASKQSRTRADFTSQDNKTSKADLPLTMMIQYYASPKAY